jgi:soluble lytic murein transglycosylase-like protein
VGVIERVAGEIEVRIPQLDPFGRRILARTIVDEAGAARIDPLLVLALIEVESSFDPAALSVRGARGLMQLREPTMRRELERHGLTLDDPHDPVANVRAGVRYLRRLLDAFGREEVALMAYNAGPNRILGYLREGEIPQRFHGYPRRVKTELRRLRRSMGPAAGTVTALAEVRPLAAVR